MKTTKFKLKDFLYLLSLYFRRGKGLSIFYIIMLILGLVLSGILLESSSKMSSLISEINKKLPPTRVKLVVPSHVTTTPKQGGLLTNLFGFKSKAQKAHPGLKYKNYISAQMLHSIEQTKGITNVVPLYSIDFPMGMVIAVPGSTTPIQTQMIGTGMSTQSAKPFLSPLSRYKEFSYTQGKPVPVLVSHFVIPVLNTLAQSNGLDNFKVDEKDLIGIKLKVFVGRSQLSNSIKKLGNGDEKEFAKIDDASFSDIRECVIAGFVDLDYTMGIAFPQDFLAPYKERYWGNFQKDGYDAVVIDLPIDNGNKIKQKFEKEGYEFAGDVGILNKLTSILQSQQQGFGEFLNFMSIVISVFAAIILFYTLIWNLRGKNLEFLIYQFFGSSKRKLITLYMTYLTCLNLVGFIIAKIIINSVFYSLKVVIMPLKTKVPLEFQDIFNAPFLNQLLVFNEFWFMSFILLEIFSIIVIKQYLRKLNNSSM